MLVKMVLCILRESWGEVGEFSVEFDFAMKMGKDAAKQVFKLLNFKLSDLNWGFG